MKLELWEDFYNVVNLERNLSEMLKHRVRTVLKSP